ncbi:MAG: hypothetical protein AAFR31_14250 [Cyanobacteria bacterium J06627_8]
MSHQLCESHWFCIDVSRDYPDIYDQSQHVHTRYRVLSQVFNFPAMFTFTPITRTRVHNTDGVTIVG